MAYHRVPAPALTVERLADIWEDVEFRGVKCPNCGTATVSRKESSRASFEKLFCPLCTFVYYRAGDDEGKLDRLVFFARRES
jgi:predicted RNA-binding Zn-ribbon protein involved in translation (DUF1610 family)